MGGLMVLLLLGGVGWAVTLARRLRQEADPGWKARLSRARTLRGLSFPNRLPGRGRPRARLLPAPFRRGDLVRVDGEWYHLPTLRRLHRDGRLPVGSPGWRALEQAGDLRRERLN